MGENSGLFTDNTPYGSRISRSNSCPPKTDFPRFDGDNQKWWKKVCEKYFTLYDVDHDTWAIFSIMHFTGNPAVWLHYEAENDIDSY
jgi:hypothetical protein